MSSEDNKIKLVIVGDGACGKTCSLNIFAGNEFPHNYEPTVFENYSVPIPLGRKILDIQIFDTAGQEEFAQLRQNAYDNTNVFILLHDITNNASFQNAIEKWLPEINGACPTAAVILVGNKSDLRDDIATVAKLNEEGIDMRTEADIKKMAMKTNAFAGIFEMSALENKGVKEAFLRGIEAGYKAKKDGISKVKIVGTDTGNSSACCEIL